ncbi:heparinase II/III family protein [Brachybacterium sp.]|uniref:heparinase II/III family protein n=1 Tax=Brachybacterium sp. TaxID=1891286 RepID=UPI002ED0D248
MTRSTDRAPDAPVGPAGSVGPTVSVGPGGSVEPDWAAAVDRAMTTTWGAEILQRVREDFTWWRTRLDIPPPGRDSEWTHHAFCADGTRLTFDPERPHHHACPTCGDSRTGEPWDGAWRTQMHNAAASQAQRAALLLRLGDDEVERRAGGEALVEILERYARDYHRYPAHGDKVGTGKVMPQNLDESIWAIALLRAVRWGGDALPDHARQLARDLAAQIARLLEPQLGQVHNIQCWVLAALAECGMRTRDVDLLERIRRGPFGVETQLREGFRREGLWYETSAFYHYYALAALLSYREAVGVDGLGAEDARVLARALEAPVTLAYSDGLLPAYGDCWPHGHLTDFVTHVAIASAVLPDCEISGSGYAPDPVGQHPIDLWIGSRWEHGTSRPMAGLPSVAALVFGPGALAQATGAPEGRSFLWPDTGLAALVSERARVTMRFGRDAGMHDHRDKLAVDVEIPGAWRSLDLGSGGYTAELTQWMRSPAAHSITSIGDQRQPAVDARLLDWSEDRVSAEVAWDGRRLRRTVHLDPDGWTDVTEAQAEGTVPLVWVFHGDGEVRADGGTVPAELPGDLPGQESLQDVRRLTAAGDDTVTAIWEIPGAPWVTLALPPGGTAYAATGAANPSGRALGVLLVRVHAEQARFEARFTVPSAGRAT